MVPVFSEIDQIPRAGIHSALWGGCGDGDRILGLLGNFIQVIKNVIEIVITVLATITPLLNCLDKSIYINKWK